MVRSAIKCILVSAVALLAGCGGGGQKSHETTFVTPGRPDTDRSDQSPEDPFSSEDPEIVAPMLTKPERRVEMPAYEVPEQLRERITRELPQFEFPRATKFRVVNQHLKINVKTKTMTFTGVLQVGGKADEALELECKFDPAKTWSCADMVPVKAEIARERRLQATVNCLDVYRCDKVGLKLFVRIEGRTESRLFQSGKFEIRRASSGDIDESPLIPPPQPSLGTPEIKPAPKDKKLKDRPLIFEKPRPSENRPAPLLPPTQEPTVNEEELANLIEDSNAAMEVTAPLPVPAPVRSEFSIPDIEKLHPEIGAGVPNQAIGTHNDGRLAEAAKLPENGPGFLARRRVDRAFGTNLMIDMLREAAGQVERAVPNKSPILISNISKSIGGRLCNGKSCHKSHQTGLDVDVAFPSNSRPVHTLWSICGSESGRCNGKPISKEFDAQRFWLFAKQFACAQDNPLIAMFVDTDIKKYMCRWARDVAKENIDDPSSCAFKTLKAMKYEPGHHNHFHMRLRCPGNRDCRDATVSLGRGTGC